MKESHKILMKPLKDKLKNIPRFSGVYLMLDKKGEVIYIGKANNLNARVRSYLNVKSWEQRPKLHFMMPKVNDIKTVITNSEKESLILEANLVNKYQPRYNVTLKDDKKFPWLMITYDETYPRVIPIRDVVGFQKKYPKTKNKFFGPYTDVGAMWDTYKILKEGFQLRLRRKPLFKDRPCMNYHIGLCSGPCQKLISDNEYQKIVKQVDDFLMGKYDAVLDNMKKQMDSASDNLQYEKAKKIRDTIRSIKKVLEKQLVVSENISLSQDVFAAVINEQFKVVVLELFMVRGGKVISIESFPVKLPQHTLLKEAFGESIKQYYSRIADENLPDEIVVQYEIKEREKIEEWISGRKQKKVKLVCPEKGKKRDLILMVCDNAKHALNKVIMSEINTVYEDIDSTLKGLQEKLKLKNLPYKIECFDISHLGGTGTVASMVAFVHGKPLKENYRKYKLKTVIGKIDDYESIREVIRRRYSKINNVEPPDLIIIDGGKGQLSAAKKVLKELDFDFNKTDLISIAKKKEEIFKINEKKAVVLDKASFELHLLQRIRDEAHRFAIGFQRELRKKHTFES
ncbi:MAG: excinuclease ABC subunit C [Candidatus Melainabacteria bacterium]|nr:excinuclease ABC subunit C [Candidatus Melainabacteria bacterium]